MSLFVRIFSAELLDLCLFATFERYQLVVLLLYAIYIADWAFAGHLLAYLPTPT
jgi:hypothetical protein